MIRLRKKQLCLILAKRARRLMVSRLQFVSAFSDRTRYTGRVEFEWDPIKAAGNFRKHKVSFDEAATVFGDFLGITTSDPEHSLSEHRFITIGWSDRRRLLMVSYAERGKRIRIVSARSTTRSEKKAYEETHR